uniref:ABC transmembrane type-1 domain-containing protein n=1 Tax=Panagrolaimus sp. PS1159 TaxID=55785 RepID=A0AC35G8N1_9BILA
EVREVLAQLEKLDPVKTRELQRQISQSVERLSPSPSPGPLSPARRTETARKSIENFEKESLLNNSNANHTANATKKIDDGFGTNEKSKLIEKEGMETGKVKLSVYMTYLKAIGWKVSLLFLVIYIVSSILGVFSNLYLADWSDHAAAIQKGENGSAGSHVRLGIYTALGLGQAFSVCIASILMALGMVIASRILHEAMLTNILRSPMSFFDVTPLGRILNRFGKDIAVTDLQLPASLINMIGMLVQGIFILSVPIIVTPSILFGLIPVIFGYFLLLDVEGLDAAIPRSLMSFVRTAIASLEIIAVIAFATPMFIICFVILAIIYMFILRFYVSTSRQLKRLESTTRSPIYSHFQESIQGASSIRAYHCTENFLLESQNRVDYNMLSYYPSIVANRWLAVRLELVGNLIVLLSALL